MINHTVITHGDNLFPQTGPSTLAHVIYGYPSSLSDYIQELGKA